MEASAVARDRAVAPKGHRGQLLFRAGLVALACALLLTACAAAPAPSDTASAPSAAPADAQPGNLVEPVPDPRRMVIYTASISLDVQDVGQAQSGAERIAQELGGYVAGSNRRAEGDRETATVTLKVPADRYGEAMTRLRSLASRVREESSTAQDVTEEYADLDAQLRNLQATEAQYLRLLERATTVDDILKVQQRLSETRGQIERIKGRLQVLERRTDFATITANLSAAASTIRPDSSWDPAVVVVRAWNASVWFWRVLAEVVISVLVFGWWLILIAAGAVWFVRNRRAQRRTPADHVVP